MFTKVLLAMVFLLFVALSLGTLIDLGSDSKPYPRTIVKTRAADAASVLAFGLLAVVMWMALRAMP